MNLEQCYKVFGISPYASDREVKQAYRNLIKSWHPDLFSSNPHLQKKAEEKLKTVNRIYKILIKERYRSQAQANVSIPIYDNRAYYRKSCIIYVNYHLRNNVFRSSSGDIRNISANGIFIKTKTAFPVGEKLSIAFSLPMFGDIMSVPGKIVRTNATGIGVKLEISHQYQKFLSRFV